MSLSSSRIYFLNKITSETEFQICLMQSYALSVNKLSCRPISVQSWAQNRFFLFKNSQVETSILAIANIEFRWIFPSLKILKCVSILIQKTFIVFQSFNFISWFSYFWYTLSFIGFQSPLQTIIKYIMEITF